MSLRGSLRCLICAAMACSNALALRLLWWDWEAVAGVCHRCLHPRGCPEARRSLHSLLRWHCGHRSGGTQTWRSGGLPPA